jgi:hypothetical protein
MQRSPPDHGKDGHFERTDKLPSSLLDDTGPTPRPFLPALPADMGELAESLREQEQQLELERQRVASLEEDLETLKQRCLELHRECEDLRATRPSRTPEGAVPVVAPAVNAAPAVTPPPAAPTVMVPVIAPPVKAPQRQPPVSASVYAELAQLRRQNERLHEALTTAQAMLGIRDAMLAQVQADRRRLRGVAGTVEQPAHAEWQHRCAELNQALERERAASLQRAHAQESRLEALEVELDAVRVRLEPPARFLAAGEPPGVQTHTVPNVLRVLVREEDGTELVYPLGRHTTIGRTPDNDIQVDASWISRHHAVVLGATDHCIVEDLHSTNGLLVNGHRVTRHVLRDGDTVTIGSTQFEYQQRA